MDSGCSRAKEEKKPRLCIVVMQKGEVAGQILFYSDYAKVIYILSGTLRGEREEKVVYLLVNNLK